MTFVPVLVSRPVDAPVSVAISKPKKPGIAPKLLIQLRHEARPAHWIRGTKVEVAFGSGTHRGKLRISDKGSCCFSLLSAGRGGDTCFLRLPLPDGVDPTPRRGAVSFERGWGEMLIALPEWAFSYASEQPAERSIPR
jgi:hypothetical protein